MSFSVLRIRKSVFPSMISILWLVISLRSMYIVGKRSRHDEDSYLETFQIVFDLLSRSLILTLLLLANFKVLFHAMRIFQLFILVISFVIKGNHVIYYMTRRITSFIHVLCHFVASKMVASNQTVALKMK